MYVLSIGGALHKVVTSMQFCKSESIYGVIFRESSFELAGLYSRTFDSKLSSTKGRRLPAGDLWAYDQVLAPYKPLHQNTSLALRRILYQVLDGRVPRCHLKSVPVRLVCPAHQYGEDDEGPLVTSDWKALRVTRHISRFGS